MHSSRFIRSLEVDRSTGVPGRCCFKGFAVYGIIMDAV